MPTPAFHTARLLEKKALTPNIRHFRLALVDPPSLPFRAGQFIQFVIGPKVLRQYSICSPPSLLGHIELCADIAPGGEGSRFLEALREGEEVQFRGPFGVFVVPPTETRPLEFVATGAGIAPFRAIIPDLLERGKAPPVRLLFGNRSEEHLFYDEEFREIAARHPQFEYVPTLSRPHAGWTGERGRVTEVLRRQAVGAGRAWYVCGSPQMVDDTRKVLKELGVPESDVHFEKFFNLEEGPDL